MNSFEFDSIKTGIMCSSLGHADMLECWIRSSINMNQKKLEIENEEARHNLNLKLYRI